MSQCIETPLFMQEVPEKGTVNGHIKFTLKSRAPADIALVGFCANVTASLLFERMQAQGTNILIHMTKEQASIDVLARTENDGLHLMWEGKQADPSTLSSIQERIKNKTFFIGKDAKPEAKAPQAEVKPASQQPAPPELTMAQPAKDDLSEADEDYLIKQLHRVP